MIRVSYTSRIALLIASIFIFSACTNTSLSQGATPIPFHEQNLTILSASDTVSAYKNGESLECMSESTVSGQHLDTRIQGDRALLTNIDFGDGVKTGNILISKGISYAWKDGSTTGWKATFPSETTLSEIINRAHNKRLGIPDITTDSGIQESIQNGDSIQCVRSEFTQDTFTPRESVNYEDISSIVDHFFQ